MPTKTFSLLNDGVDWKQNFKIVSDFYVADLPNPLGVDAELLLWQTFCEHRNSPYPSNIAAPLKL